MSFYEDNINSYVNVKVYTAEGNLSGGSGSVINIPAADYQNNLFWTGQLYFPHAYDFMSRFSAGVNYTLMNSAGITSIFNQLVDTYSPAFSMLSAVASSSNHAGRLLSFIFPMLRAYAGNENQKLHIVVAEGADVAYVYDAVCTGGGWVDGVLSDAVWANMNDNGDLTLNYEKPLCMPHLTANAGSNRIYYFRGFLISEISDNYTVSNIIDCNVNGYTQYITGLGYATLAYFNERPNIHDATIEFINRWPLNGRSLFSHISFLQGFLTGRRLHNDAESGATGTTFPDNPEYSADYHRDSFMAGLAAGCAGKRPFIPFIPTTSMQNEG